MGISEFCYVYASKKRPVYSEIPHDGFVCFKV